MRLTALFLSVLVYAGAAESGTRMLRTPTVSATSIAFAYCLHRRAPLGLLTRRRGSGLFRLKVEWKSRWRCLALIRGSTPLTGRILLTA
jgi:hypothetical protein